VGLKSPADGYISEEVQILWKQGHYGKKKMFSLEKKQKLTIKNQMKTKQTKRKDRQIR